MMKHGIKAMILAGVLLVAGTAWAMPLPDFILYGQADDGTLVAARWNDREISSSISKDGYFKLSIPMDTESEYSTGAVIELWINGAPVGHMVTIGKIGTAQHIAYLLARYVL